jgi:hypothetical protein
MATFSPAASGAGRSPYARRRTRPARRRASATLCVCQTGPAWARAATRSVRLAIPWPQESGGKWRAATEISALPPTATGASVDGVSCASARLCVAAGGYSTNSSLTLAYLVSFVSGHWQDAGGVSLPANALSPPSGSTSLRTRCGSASARPRSRRCVVPLLSSPGQRRPRSGGLAAEFAVENDSRPVRTLRR